MANRTIGGVVYRELTETTMEQDDAILRIVRAANVEELQMEDGEKADDFVARILSELISSGKAFGLLGCFLVPEGKEWSRALAAETAETFRRVTAGEDKAELRSALVPLLMTFFVTGLASVVISRRYSNQLRGIVGQPQQIAAPSTSATGLRLFVWWLVGILARRWKWLVGQFGKPS